MQSLSTRDCTFYWGQRTYIMGILNVTPDSFSDGGQYDTLNNALTQATRLIEAGADIIDIGGQSTRPGAKTVALDEELGRTLPIIRSLRETSSIPISIDTTRATVAQAAIEVGADLVNDISGGTFDEQMFSVVAKLAVPIIIMHLRGKPQTMQKMTEYENLIAEIKQFLENQVNIALQAGIERSRLIIDPGIGFAKNYTQNLELLRHLAEFRSLGLPILVGPSRKSFIGHILKQNDPQQRVWGTAAACCAAVAGGADIVRVHDVAPMVEVCRMADAIWRSDN